MPLPPPPRYWTAVVSGALIGLLFVAYSAWADLRIRGIRAAAKVRDSVYTAEIDRHDHTSQLLQDSLRLVAARLRQQQETVTVQVARWRTVTRWRDSVVFQALPDTAKLRLLTAENDSLRQQGQALALSCQDLSQSCQTQTRLAQAFRLQVDTLRGLLALRERARLDLVRQPRRRWGLGVSGGYGAVVTGGQVHVGPGVNVGISYSF